MKRSKKSMILTLDDMQKPLTEIPESMTKAAGLLRRHKINALGYQKKIRKEWDRRLKKLK